MTVQNIQSAWDNSFLNSSMVKSNNEIGKVNDKKNLIEKSNNKIGKL